MGRPAATSPASPRSAQAAEGYFAGSKIKLEWPPGRLEQAGQLQPGTGKVLLNLVILAEEALAYGGRIVVEPDRDGNPRVAAIGRNAGLKAEAAQALTGDIAIESLTPRTVHAYVTGRFAQHLNLKVVASQESAGDFRVQLAKLAPGHPFRIGTSLRIIDRRRPHALCRAHCHVPAVLGYICCVKPFSKIAKVRYF